ncbi:hypothetical protein TIFTF001_031146 [Ficus carica]|uniref:Uncharacterized protein n=1 Tax=Ficus carica TaxID=3494 RepID=A0AA88DUZ3_FICCA|nr:hypothetical protein TIFTF001_031146 [Ficus carica]
MRGPYFLAKFLREWRGSDPESWCRFPMNGSFHGPEGNFGFDFLANFCIFGMIFVTKNKISGLGGIGSGQGPRGRGPSSVAAPGGGVGELRSKCLGSGRGGGVKLDRSFVGSGGGRAWDLAAGSDLGDGAEEVGDRECKVSDIQKIERLRWIRLRRLAGSELISTPVIHQEEAEISRHPRGLRHQRS